jgi:L-threonylcarbamoyladenylate synthase
MQTLRLKADVREDLEQAVGIIRSGGLVAFPTETVYGLGANALDAAAVRRIFAAKQRPSWDPLIVHVASEEMIRQVALELPPKFELLAKRFMPGPLTLLMNNRPEVPPEVTAGRYKVAVRMPRHPIASALIKQAGVPIAAPSANLFGRTSPTTAEHVLADLDGRIDAVLDGGATNLGLESTVLDLSGEKPIILRQGAVTREALQGILGAIDVFTAPPSQAPPQSLPSPGVATRHYAPRTRLLLVEGNVHGIEGQLRAAVAAQAGRTGVLSPTGWNTGAGVIFDWGVWGDWETMAQHLYAGLRWLDQQDCDVILVPMPAAEGLGATIRDRLEKAAR